MLKVKVDLKIQIKNELENLSPSSFFFDVLFLRKHPLVEQTKVYFTACW